MFANAVVTLAPDTFMILWRHIWLHLNSFGYTFKIHWRHFQDTLATLRQNIQDSWRHLATPYAVVTLAPDTFMILWRHFCDIFGDTFIHLATHSRYIGNTFKTHWRHCIRIFKTVGDTLIPSTTLRYSWRHLATLRDSWRLFETVRDTWRHIHKKN